jgi:glutathione S-transferase
MSITLYYSPGACSLAPHIVLNEIGASFDLCKFSTADGGNLSSDYLAVNPKGLIPALAIDGFVVTENPAILAFLGRKFHDAKLYPPTGTKAEALCLQGLAWSSNTVHVAFGQILRPERFVLDKEFYPAVKASGQRNYQNCLKDINAYLSTTPFSAGDQYTVLDPFWLVFFRWGVRQNYEMKERFPAYTRYVEMLCERPAVSQALETEGISVWS